MSVELSRVYQEPLYYHREYENDVTVPKEEGTESSWINISQRVAFASLPFFSLYKPLSLPISLMMGGVRVFTSASELYNLVQSGNTQEIPQQVLLTAISVIALAGTIIAHPLGMLITTGQDIFFDCNNLIHDLSEGNYSKALERSISIVNNVLYLGLFFTGSLELSIASFSVQVILGLYNSSEDFKNGRWIEGSAHLMMSAVRVHQLTGLIRIRNEIHQVLHRNETQQKVEKTQANTKVTTSQRYETRNVQLVYYQGYNFHIADYVDGTRIVTCLDGAERGLQGVYYNGTILESRAVQWYNDHFVHFYPGGKVISYSNRQVLEIY